MKLTDNLLKHFGTDKVLHCSLAGWAVSLAGLACWQMALGFTALIIVLSIYKEYRLDSKVDWLDLLAAVIGMGLSWLAIVVSLIR